MAGKCLQIVALSVLVLAVGCAPKRVSVAKQNVFVLLPEPEGNPSGIVVKNAAGAQVLSQPYQAVRVERADVSPSAPFTLDPAEVKRLFGAALDVLPAPEVQFLLYFDEDKDVLTAESEAQLPAIMNAIRERHSTAITVTGHTDTMGDSQYNYELGMKRAQRVAGILLGQGVKESDLFVSSHGDSDLLVKTARGVAEARNRRVEVIVR
jgi:outer membrane protein OmpA-like peptidoglycan-associated protein